MNNLGKINSINKNKLKEINMKKSIRNIELKEHECFQHLINVEEHSFMYHEKFYAFKRCECSVCRQVFTREDPTNYFLIK